MPFVFLAVAKKKGVEHLVMEINYLILMESLLSLNTQEMYFLLTQLPNLLSNPISLI